MSDRLIDIEGIGPTHAATLAEHGLTTTDDLLARGARPAGRAELAQATGIAPALILEWVNHADLFRIKGVAGQFADLLEEAGVDTVVELSHRNPDNLTKALAETNAAKNLANRDASASEVADWVAQAKTMARAVFYDDAAAVAPDPAAPGPADAADAAPAPTAAPAPAASRPLAAPMAATPARSWFARLVDRVRGH